MWVVALANRIAIVYTNAPNQRREAVLADLCTLLRTHGCPQRRNSVHKCPETAPRGRFCRSVYTPASPPKGRLVGEGSTACSRARRAAAEDLYSWLRSRPKGTFDGVLARKAHGGSGNARTGGEAETLRWVSDDLFPEAGDCPGPGRPEHAPRGVALRDVPVGGGRAAGLPPRGPSHTPRNVSRQLTEQGHPARVLSPKPARACICRQRRSRSPQRPSPSR